MAESRALSRGLPVPSAERLADDILELLLRLDAAR